MCKSIEHPTAEEAKELFEATEICLSPGCDKELDEDGCCPDHGSTFSLAEDEMNAELGGHRENFEPPRNQNGN